MSSFHACLPVRKPVLSLAFTVRLPLLPEEGDVLDQKAHLLVRLDRLRTSAAPHHADQSFHQVHRLRVDFDVLGLMQARIDVGVEPSAQSELEHPAAGDDARTPDPAPTVHEDGGPPKRVALDELGQMCV